MLLDTGLILNTSNIFQRNFDAAEIYQGQNYFNHWTEKLNLTWAQGWTIKKNFIGLAPETNVKPSRGTVLVFVMRSEDEDVVKLQLDVVTDILTLTSAIKTKTTRRDATRCCSGMGRRKDSENLQKVLTFRREATEAVFSSAVKLQSAAVIHSKFAWVIS